MRGDCFSLAASRPLLALLCRLQSDDDDDDDDDDYFLPLARGHYTGHNKRPGGGTKQTKKYGVCDIPNSVGLENM